jgi:hypothetical protein
MLERDRKREIKRERMLARVRTPFQRSKRERKRGRERKKE